jgi:lysophospholipase L1-like esterase
MRRRLLLTLVAVVAVLVTLSIFRPWRLTVVFVESLVPSKVLLVGDSLNVGIEQNLRDRLPRWQVSADDEIGRPTATGVERLRAAGASLAPYLVLSLGTNDSASEVDAFRGDVAEALRIAGPNRCVVWATIHRDGNADDSFNGVLRAAATRNRNVRLVEWAEMIDKHPEWLALDGIHGNPDGYAARAEAVVAAMRSCHEAGIGS